MKQLSQFCQQLVTLLQMWVVRLSLFHCQILLVEIPVHVGNGLSYYQLHQFQSNLQASFGKNTTVHPFFVGFALFGVFLVLFLKGNL